MGSKMLANFTESSSPPLFQDIAYPRDLLPELAASRTKHHELIFLCSNHKHWDLAVNLVANLERLQLYNYLMLVDKEETALAAKRRGTVAAVWSSLLDRFTTPVRKGPLVSADCPRQCAERPRKDESSSTDIDMAELKRCETATKQHCLQSAAGYYKMDDVRRTWILRYYYVARLVGLKYNVLLLDTDSILYMNPYPLFHRHFAEYKVIMLDDNTASPQLHINGGTLYIQAGMALALPSMLGLAQTPPLACTRTRTLIGILTSTPSLACISRLQPRSQPRPWYRPQPWP